MLNFSRESAKGAWRPASACDRNIHMVIRLRRHARTPVFTSGVR